MNFKGVPGQTSYLDNGPNGDQVGRHADFREVWIYQKPIIAQIKPAQLNISKYLDKGYIEKKACQTQQYDQGSVDHYDP